MSDVIKIGLEGVIRGITSAADHAQKITSAAQQGDFDQVVANSVELQNDKHQVQASAKVIKIGGELLDETLKIIA